MCLAIYCSSILQRKPSWIETSILLFYCFHSCFLNSFAQSVVIFKFDKNKLERFGISKTIIFSIPLFPIGSSCIERCYKLEQNLFVSKFAVLFPNEHPEKYNLAAFFIMSIKSLVISHSTKQNNDVYSVYNSVNITALTMSMCWGLLALKFAKYKHYFELTNPTMPKFFMI